MNSQLLSCSAMLISKLVQWNHDFSRDRNDSFHLIDFDVLNVKVVLGFWVSNDALFNAFGVFDQLLSFVVVVDQERIIFLDFTW